MSCCHENRKPALALSSVTAHIYCCCQCCAAINSPCQQYECAFFHCTFALQSWTRSYYLVLASRFNVLPQPLFLLSYFELVLVFIISVLSHTNIGHFCLVCHVVISLAMESFCFLSNNDVPIGMWIVSGLVGSIDGLVTLRIRLWRSAVCMLCRTLTSTILQWWTDACVQRMTRVQSLTADALLKFYW